MTQMQALKKLKRARPMSFRPSCGPSSRRSVLGSTRYWISAQLPFTTAEPCLTRYVFPTASG